MEKRNSALLGTDHGVVCKLMVCWKISVNFSPHSGPENTSKFYVAVFLKVIDEFSEGEKAVSRKLYGKMLPRTLQSLEEGNGLVKLEALKKVGNTSFSCYLLGKLFFSTCICK